jgi:hypothetical protein
MYVDGASQYSNSSYSSYWSYEIKFQYFGKPVAANTYFGGNMNEMAYWNSALTPSNVSTIYNSGIPGDLTSLSPLAWYRLNEGSGTTATDSAGSNNGTINGATYSTDVPS